MPKLTHYLVPKDGGKDPLNLSRQGFNALAIELIGVEGDEIIYRATSKRWADLAPPERVSVSDYAYTETKPDKSREGS